MSYQKGQGFESFQLEPKNLPQGETDNEIWSPFGRWNCFCCSDTGIVQKYLVKKIMPDYGKSRYHKDVKCTRCNAVNEKFAESVVNSLDDRFPPHLCEELHIYCQEDWKRTIKHKQELLQQTGKSYKDLIKDAIKEKLEGKRFRYKKGSMKIDVLD